MPQQRTVGILLFDAVDVLDISGPLEVFVIASRLLKDQKPFRVFTVAEHAVPILTRGQLSVNPRYSFQDCPALDILVVPGGSGIRREMDNIVLINWIREKARHAELVLSVSTGAFLLAQAGLLDGLKVTTHQGAINKLKQAAPHAVVQAGVRFVDNGQIITSAGITAGIDAALHVVARLLGHETAQQTAKCLEYAWRPISTSVSSDV